MELKPCPKCGSVFGKYEAYITRFGEHCYRCRNCGFIASSVVSSADALKLWNAAPRQSTIELKPCWNCGSSRIWRQSSARDFHYFRCEDCGTCAPDSPTISGAAELWNAHERKPDPAVESAEWHPDEWRRQYNAMQKRAVKAERKLKKAKAEERTFSDAGETGRALERKCSRYDEHYKKLLKLMELNYLRDNVEDGINGLLRQQEKDSEKIAQLEAEISGERRHAITAEQQLADAHGTIAQLEADLEESQRARLELQEQVQGLEAEIIVKEDERLALLEDCGAHVTEINNLVNALQEIVGKLEYAAGDPRAAIASAAEIARDALRDPEK